MRCSLYIEGAAGEKAIIDTGPEFRLQALEAGITGLDAVFLTHAHADHIHGLDDIRPFTWERLIPVYGNRETIEEFKERFSYIFTVTQEGGGKPRITVGIADGPIQLGALTFTPIPVKHGDLDILGWKIGEQGGSASVVYLTDTSRIDEDSFKLMGAAPEGPEPSPPALLIIGGLRERPHATHFSFEEALNAALRIGAKRVYLTHLTHKHSHREVEEFCRNFAKKRGLMGISMGPAWDGLEISL
jgi:phosphoribosyl 1,2-cyclic phosphate phosphodiesterase